MGGLSAATVGVGATVLAGHGMRVNTADADSIRAKLGDFYARWRAKFDAKIWAVLEAQVGGVGGSAASTTVTCRPSAPTRSARTAGQKQDPAA